MERGVAFIIALGWLGCGANVVVDGPTLEGDCERFCEHTAACELQGYGGMSSCVEGCLEVVKLSFDCEPEARAVLACHLEQLDAGSCAPFDGECEDERDELNRCDDENAD